MAKSNPAQALAAANARITSLEGNLSGSTARLAQALDKQAVLHRIIAKGDLIQSKLESELTGLEAKHKACKRELQHCYYAMYALTAALVITLGIIL